MRKLTGVALLMGSLVALIGAVAPGISPSVGSAAASLAQDAPLPHYAPPHALGIPTEHGELIDRARRDRELAGAGRLRLGALSDGRYEIEWTSARGVLELTLPRLRARYLHRTQLVVERRYSGEPVEVVLGSYERILGPRRGSPAIPPREGVPLICPGREADRRAAPSRGGWNAKQVLGMKLGRAERLARHHGCTVRPVWADGSRLAVTMDHNPARVNVALRGKRIVRIVGLA